MQQTLELPRRQALQARLEGRLELDGLPHVVLHPCEQARHALPEALADALPEVGPVLRAVGHKEKRLVMRTLLLHAPAHLPEHQLAHLLPLGALHERVQQHLRRQESLGDLLPVEGGHPLLALQEEALELEAAAADAPRLHGVEDDLQGDHVGVVPDDDAARGQDPPLPAEEPHEHLQDAEDEAQVEAGCADEVELVCAADEEDVVQDLRVGHQALHRASFQVEHVVDVPLHVGDAARHHRLRLPDGLLLEHPVRGRRQVLPELRAVAPPRLLQDVRQNVRQEARHLPRHPLGAHPAEDLLNLDKLLCH
mmetsp:Transcript_7264/g.19643  ORF Transcript_7264/g.19643 Transcript_7264/m.19643 type:complete len:309 (-) Transcript_7264:571-1497(-)